MTSDTARSIRQPLDRQRKAPRRACGKPGTHWERAVAAYRNRAVATVEDTLKARGADDELARRMRSAVGCAVAKAYRAETGAEPQQCGWAVTRKHRLTPVFAYPDRALLDSVIDGYELADPRAPKGGKAPRVRLTDLMGS
jgi:hypothetical protein